MASTPTPPDTTAGTAPRTVMVLGKTLFFKGELSSEEDLVVLGRVEGSVTHTENLTIGAGGVVMGDLKARMVTVKGVVEGDIQATECIVVAPSATILGDLTAPRVVLVEGARFTGAVSMPARAPARSLEQAPASPASRATLEPEIESVVSARAVDRMLSAR